MSMRKTRKRPRRKQRRKRKILGKRCILAVYAWCGTKGPLSYLVGIHFAGSVLGNSGFKEGIAHFVTTLSWRFWTFSEHSYALTLNTSVITSIHACFSAEDNCST
uniref:Uncharacterized protein n=1 Tax=Opuntia streptacantha TaxID=393608 RepID=A0A7C9E4K0_OPUST